MATYKAILGEPVKVQGVAKAANGKVLNVIYFAHDNTVPNYLVIDKRCNDYCIPSLREDEASNVWVKFPYKSAQILLWEYKR